MDNILVTGATGLLGRSLIPHLKMRGHNIVTQSRVEDSDFLIDLSDKKNVFPLKLKKSKKICTIILMVLTFTK